MDAIKSLKAMGLFSGSSMDGVNVSIINTDGVDVYETGRSEIFPYDESLRERLKSIQGKKPEADNLQQTFAEVEKELTEFHAEVVKEFGAEDIDIIGFHGHTVCHEPQNHYTSQLGDGKLLAKLTGVQVVNRFPRADIFAGGQGSPLYPIYHAALCANEEKPLAVLNIGGISSLTWLGRNGEMLAFDTGPGNAVIDDWVYHKGAQHMDYNGKLAITGKVNEKIIASLMRHKFFAKYPPKATDRDTFKDKLEHLEGLSLEDGAATATAFVAESIAYSLSLYLPEKPLRLIICGGGARNPTLRRFLRARVEDMEVISGDDLGWNVSAIESQAFAYLAVRRLYELPSSFPETTGALAPIVCGELHKAVKSEK